MSQQAQVRSPINARAAVLREDGTTSIEDVLLEAPRDDEVLVRIVATGVCHTDMVMRDGGLPTPKPVVLGHEGAGVVEAVGAGVTRLAPGDHVVLSFNSCGHCAPCADDVPGYCEEFFPRNFLGTRPDGSSPISGAGGVVHGNIFGQSSFATHAIARERNAVKVAPDTPLDLVGPLGCGILTGAGAILKALRVKPDSSVAIFGAGAVGLSALLAAKIAGAKHIIAVDRNPARLEIATELGATSVFQNADSPTVEAIKDLTAGGLDYALDTTAHPAVVRAAADCLGQRGVLGLAGASAPGDEIKLDAVSIMSGGRMVRGIVEGDADPHSFIPELIALHAQGLFPFDKLTKHYPFDDILQAIADGENGLVVKPIIKMPEIGAF